MPLVDQNGWPDGRNHQSAYHSAKSTSYSRRRHFRWLADPHCYYCRCDLHSWEVTFDHVIPRSKGGTNADDNLVIACADCNTKKADSMPVLGVEQ